MKRINLTLAFTVTAITVALLMYAGERKDVVPKSPHGSQQAGTSATPLILQETDGDQLVHRAGPLRGYHSRSKLIDNLENQRIFLSSLKGWPQNRQSHFTSMKMLKRYCSFRKQELP
jgi:hypothetical protein